MHWLKKLQVEDGKGYSSIQTIRGVLRPAFRKAVQDELIFKNPFDDFQLHEVTVNDTVKRDALSPADKRRFLEFIRTDRHFSRYYEGIYILFHTGMRISEFCGLTIGDLNMEKGTISVSTNSCSVSAPGFILKTRRKQGVDRVLFRWNPR